MYVNLIQLKYYQWSFQRVLFHYYLLPGIYYCCILLNNYLPKWYYIIPLKRVSSIIIFSRGRSNTFTTIITCTNIIMEDLLFHFRLCLLHYLLMNQHLSALLDYDVLTLISANDSASSTAHPHS